MRNLDKQYIFTHNGKTYKSKELSILAETSLQNIYKLVSRSIDINKYNSIQKFTMFVKTDKMFEEFGHFKVEFDVVIENTKNNIFKEVSNA